MKNRPPRLASNMMGRMASAVIPLIIMATPIQAQQSGSPSPASAIGRSDPARERMLDMRRRETMLREGGVESKEAPDQRQIEAIIAQIKKDFERIQVVRNEMVRAISKEGALDYRHISEATAEINKRASRLKTYLALHHPDDDEKSQVKFNDEQIKDALVMLCNRIFGFVTNPVLKVPETVDLQQSAKASRDLQSIIELSDSIGKSAEKLKKISR